MHPDPTAVPAQGVRQTAHRVQLRAVETRREARKPRETAQRPGPAGLSGVLAGDDRRHPDGRAGRSQRRGAGRAVGDDDERCPAHVAESQYVEVLGKISPRTLFTPLLFVAASAAVEETHSVKVTILTVWIEGPTRHRPDERHRRAEGEAEGEGEGQGEAPDRSGEVAVEAARL